MNLSQKQFKNLMLVLKLGHWEEEDTLLTASGEIAGNYIFISWKIGYDEPVEIDDLCVAEECEWQLTEEQMNQLRDFADECEKERVRQLEESRSLMETQESLNNWLNHNVL